MTTTTGAVRVAVRLDEEPVAAGPTRRAQDEHAAPRGSGRAREAPARRARVGADADAEAGAGANAERSLPSSTYRMRTVVGAVRSPTLPGDVLGRDLELVVAGRKRAAAAAATPDALVLERPEAASARVARRSRRAVRAPARRGGRCTVTFSSRRSPSGEKRSGATVASSTRGGVVSTRIGLGISIRRCSSGRRMRGVYDPSGTTSPASSRPSQRRRTGPAP